jgi:hypothetical protein
MQHIIRRKFDVYVIPKQNEVKKLEEILRDQCFSSKQVERLAALG